MTKVRELQGVSTYLKTPKAKGARRHPSHCIYHEGKGVARICKCRKSSMYMIHCGSASRCDYYVDENE